MGCAPGAGIRGPSVGGEADKESHLGITEYSLTQPLIEYMSISQ